MLQEAIFFDYDLIYVVDHEYGATSVYYDVEFIGFFEKVIGLPKRSKYYMKERALRELSQTHRHKAVYSLFNRL